MGVDKLDADPVELADEDEEDEVIEDELELEFNVVGGRLGILVFGVIGVIGGVTNCCLPFFVLVPNGLGFGGCPEGMVRPCGYPLGVVPGGNGGNDIGAA